MNNYSHPFFLCPSLPNDFVKYPINITNITNIETIEPITSILPSGIKSLAKYPIVAITANIPPAMANIINKSTALHTVNRIPNPKP